MFQIKLDWYVIVFLRFDLFWDKIDKKYANLEEPDPYSLSVLHFE